MQGEPAGLYGTAEDHPFIARIVQRLHEVGVSPATFETWQADLEKEFERKNIYGLSLEQISNQNMMVDARTIIDVQRELVSAVNNVVLLQQELRESLKLIKVDMEEVRKMQERQYDLGFAARKMNDVVGQLVEKFKLTGLNENQQGTCMHMHVFTLIRYLHMCICKH